MTLQDEIKQSRPFESREQEAMLSLVRTAAVLEHRFAAALRPYGITPTQYNVLRILRGAGPSGLCRHEMRDRMVTLVPDVTRLLDRLEVMQLVARERDPADRRQVTARITSRGLALLEELDEPVQRIHRDQLAHLDPERVERLIELLAEVRTSQPRARPGSEGVAAAVTKAERSTEVR
jgi:DNA-binding MarR family transcriptional regulator